MDGGRGHISVDAIDPQGHYVNKLDFTAHIAQPNNGGLKAPPALEAGAAPDRAGPLRGLVRRAAYRHLSRQRHAEEDRRQPQRLDRRRPLHRLLAGVQRHAVEPLPDDPTGLGGQRAHRAYSRLHLRRRASGRLLGGGHDSAVPARWRCCSCPSTSRFAGWPSTAAMRAAPGPGCAPAPPEPPRSAAPPPNWAACWTAKARSSPSAKRSWPRRLPAATSPAAACLGQRRQARAPRVRRRPPARGRPVAFRRLPHPAPGRSGTASARARRRTRSRPTAPCLRARAGRGRYVPPDGGQTPRPPETGHRAGCIKYNPRPLPNGKGRLTIPFLVVSSHVQILMKHAPEASIAGRDPTPG